MANEPKTPGQVLFHAMSVALRWRPMPGEQLPDERRIDMEKVAELTVQSAIGLLDQVAAEAISQVRDARKVVANWSGEAAVTPMDEQAQCEHMDAALTAIETILDVPTQEAAEACAEDAGAERSKSPPPAER